MIIMKTNQNHALERLIREYGESKRHLGESLQARDYTQQDIWETQIAEMVRRLRDEFGIDIYFDIGELE